MPFHFNRLGGSFVQPSLGQTQTPLRRRGALPEALPGAIRGYRGGGVVPKKKKARGRDRSVGTNITGQMLASYRGGTDAGLPAAEKAKLEAQTPLPRRRRQLSAAEKAKLLAQTPYGRLKSFRGGTDRYKGKSMEPGGGGRFAKGMESLMNEGHSKESARKIMAAAGRKKYGKSKMAKWSAAGRKRAK